jgi:uncharacterized protein (DUF1330 family)
MVVDLGRHEEVAMSFLVVWDGEVTNQPGLEPYVAAVTDITKKHGGRYLAFAATPKLIEGGPEPKTVVILEFPDAGAFDRWYHSPEYQKILPCRLRNSTGRLFTVEDKVA